MSKDKMPNDDKIRDVLSDTKLVASENLRYRIMNQIQVEMLFQRKRRKDNPTAIKSALITLGVIYVLLLAIGFGLYLGLGDSLVDPTNYVGIFFCLFSVGSFYLAISLFDELRMSKKQKEKKDAI